jgi:dTDP-4-amino-4,6-dideoxygalactose transaminase
MEKVSEHINFVNSTPQNKALSEKLIKILNELIEDRYFILGNYLKEFEEKIAAYCQTKYALGVNSGTDALFLSLKALKIGQGDEVITAPNSFIATAATIVNCGAKPVFVDIKPDYTIDEDLIEDAVTEKTKAILPVHLAGRTAEMDKINKIAERFDLKVIEDACQAIGAEYKGKRAGSLGDIGCFSLHPSKILHVLGDGGFITTNNDGFYEKIKKLRDHGFKKRDEVDFFGYNSRLDTFHAATALIKLPHLEDWIKKRHENAKKYKEGLSNLNNIILPPNSGLQGRDVYTLFMIQADRRNELIDFLKQKNIGCKAHYPIPIHLQKAAQYLGYKKGDFPETEKQADRLVSLPIHQDLKEEEIAKIIESINQFY